MPRETGPVPSWTERFDDAVASRRLNMAALARALGVARGTLYRWREAGENGA